MRSTGRTVFVDNDYTFRATLSKCTASRKNKLYFATRELGRAVRTMLLLEYIGDQELRQTIQVA
jgi:TnpA family transposase